MVVVAVAVAVGPDAGVGLGLPNTEPTISDRGSPPSRNEIPSKGVRLPVNKRRVEGDSQDASVRNHVSPPWSLPRDEGSL